MQAFTLHSAWAHDRDDHDLTLWNLQIGNRALRWTRVDDITFDLETFEAPFLTFVFERVYLTESAIKFEVGHRWKTSMFSVEVREVELGGPTRLRFRLDKSLDESNVLFVRSVQGRHTVVAPPKVGSSIELKQPVRAGPYMP